MGDDVGGLAARLAEPAGTRAAMWTWDVTNGDLSGVEEICEVAGIPRCDGPLLDHFARWLAEETDRLRISSAISKLLVGDEPRAVRFRIYDQFGTERHLVSGATLERHEQTGHRLVTGFLRDVTAEVHARYACPGAVARPTTIGIIASDYLARVGIRSMLEPNRNVRIVAEMSADDLRSSFMADDSTADGRPELLILHVNHLESGAPETVARYRNAQAARPKVLVVAEAAAIGALEDLAALRFEALLPANVSADALSSAVLSVVREQLVLGFGLLDAVLDATKNARASLEGPALTESETTVLRMLASGMRNHEIAAELYMSVPTVKRRIQRIYHKLDARDRAHASALATTLGYA